MIGRKSNHAFSVTAFAFGVALLLADPTSARTIRVDSGDGNFGGEFGSGQAWGTEVALGASPVLQGTLPFGLNLGTGALQTGFCLRATGISFFASPLDCSDGLTNTLEPLSGDWISNPDPEADKIFEEGTITYSEGRLDVSPPYPDDPADAPRAVRFHWNDVTCATCGGFTYTFQAIIIDVGNGNGDFDLELNFLDIAAGIGQARFALGANTFSSQGPFASNTDYDYQFRNGLLVDGATPVPEPATLGLLALALLTMQGIRRRRSR